MVEVAGGHLVVVVLGHRAGRGRSTTERGERPLVGGGDVGEQEPDVARRRPGRAGRSPRRPRPARSRRRRRGSGAARAARRSRSVEHAWAQLGDLPDAFLAVGGQGEVDRRRSASLMHYLAIRSAAAGDAVHEVTEAVRRANPVRRPSAAARPESRRPLGFAPCAPTSSTTRSSPTSSPPCATRRTDSPTFRRLADELVTLLAYEATRDVRVEPGRHHHAGRADRPASGSPAPSRWWCRSCAPGSACSRG